MFTIKFKTENDAFGDDDHEMLVSETARILREIADKVENGADGGPVFDANGNRVGDWWFGS